MKKLVLLVALVAASTAVLAATASADYGKGAQYQIELSANIPGSQGGGVWLWVELNKDGTGDYTGSDCGRGADARAQADKGDVTWKQVGDSLVIDGVVFNGLPTDPANGDFSPWQTTITVPAAYGHYTGTAGQYETLPYFIPSDVGFAQLQVAP